MLFLLLLLLGEPDLRTDFDHEANTKGAGIWQRCTTAMGASYLKQHTWFHMELEVQSARGKTWTNHYVLNLKQPEMVRTRSGSHYDLQYGFDGHQPWKGKRKPHAGVALKEVDGGLTSSFERGSAEESTRIWRAIVPVLITQNLKAAWLAETDVDGEACDLVRLLDPTNGSLFLDVWVAQETGWIVRIREWTLRTGKQPRAAEQFFRDYRQVGEAWLPHMWGRKFTYKLQHAGPVKEAPNFKKPVDAHYLPPYLEPQ